MNHNKLTNFLIGAIAVSILGCTEYVEQPTPPGTIAPPPIQVAAPAPSTYPEPYRTPSTYTDEGTIQEDSLSSSQGTENQPLFSSSIIDAFSDSYRKNGSPRLAIFFNRMLSDEVREWRTESRAVLSIQGQVEEQGEEGERNSKGVGGFSAYSQQHLESGQRQSLGEGWMWRFEDGFLNPFLSIGAKVVDRATIMRLTAASSGRQGSAHDPIAVKKVEMDSLLGKADLFVEILIRREASSPLGYEFKSSIKEVKTGIIRANVTSFDWNYGPQEKERKVVATSTGYEFVDDDDTGNFPEINVISRDLALATMKALMHNMGQG